jgi:hypothetical protein
MLLLPLCERRRCAKGRRLDPVALSYHEKLKDPRWQRLRLETLDLAEWSCSWCGDTETTLHVHHNFYVRGRQPWEYSAAELSVLCEHCHGDTEARVVALTECLALIAPAMLDAMIGFARAVALQSQDRESEQPRLANVEQAMGFVRASGSAVSAQDAGFFTGPDELSLASLAALFKPVPTLRRDAGSE